MCSLDTTASSAVGPGGPWCEGRWLAVEAAVAFVIAWMTLPEEAEEDEAEAWWWLGCGDGGGPRACDGGGGDGCAEDLVGLACPPSRDCGGILRTLSSSPAFCAKSSSRRRRRPSPPCCGGSIPPTPFSFFFFADFAFTGPAFGRKLPRALPAPDCSPPGPSAAPPPQNPEDTDSVARINSAICR